MSNPFYGQGKVSFNIPDSLKGKTYKELVNDYYRVESDSVQALLYANIYLQKGKNDRDSIKMAEGYHFIYFLNKNEPNINYLDSIISISKDSNNKIYPAIAYILKGTIFYDQEDFKNSLNNYLQAVYYTKKNQNNHFLMTAKGNIGILKSRIGKYNEAIQTFKDLHNFYKIDNNRELYSIDYLNNLFCLATDYAKVKKIDSSSIMNKLGYLESLKANNMEINASFILNEGVNGYSGDTDPHSGHVDPSVDFGFKKILSDKITVFF